MFGMALGQGEITCRETVVDKAGMIDGQGQFSELFKQDGWPTTVVLGKGGKLIGTCDTNGPSYVDEVVDLIAKAQQDYYN